MAIKYSGAGGRHDRTLPDLMGEGLADCEIQARWNISKGTFFDWLKKHQTFAEAYQLGLPKRKAFFIEKARKAMLKGDDKGFKYFKALSTEIIDWKHADEVSSQSKGNVTNQINVNSLNVFENDARENVLRYCQQMLETLPVGIENKIEQKEEQIIDAQIEAKSTENTNEESQEPRSE